MVTITTNDKCFEFWGKSTDTKPVNPDNEHIFIGNGSLFIEENTAEVFVFDQENNTWIVFGG